VDGKKYLQNIKKFDTIIKQKENEKKELEYKKYSISAVDNSSVKVKTSNISFSYNLIDDCIDKVNKLNKEIKELENKKQCIINKIRQLNQSEYIDVLYKRYAGFKSFEEIAIETGYSKSNIWKIHSKAIKAFEKLGVNYSKRE